MIEGEIAGAQRSRILAHKKLVVPLFHVNRALADRDPSMFENPHVVDIDRKSRHINFGTGTHNCLGVHLAKRELRIVIEEFLGRFRNIRIKDGEAYRYHTGRTFGIEYLPLVWDKI